MNFLSLESESYCGQLDNTKEIETLDWHYLGKLKVTYNLRGL